VIYRTLAHYSGLHRKAPLPRGQRLFNHALKQQRLLSRAREGAVPFVRKRLILQVPLWSRWSGGGLSPPQTEVCPTATSAFEVYQSVIKRIFQETERTDAPSNVAGMRVSSRIAAILILGVTITRAQDSPGNSTPNPVIPVPAEDKRIFGVIPNNRTTEESIPFHSISAKQKITIAAKDSFDWPVFPTAAAFAGLYQIENQNPSFGQGVKGYALRFATAYADQTIGNIMTEGLVPIVLHEDPRYFRLGERSILYRTGYALKQIVITRTDSGGHTFNFSEWGGNAIGVAISNAYYPDTRTASDNAERLLIACGTDAFSNVLKEFWPDVKKKLKQLRHH
jgi:hypothetical protein